MGQDWIIDVLADLRAFARQNQMPLLREQLEEAMLIADVEIASLVGKTAKSARADVADKIARARDIDTGHNA